VAVIMLLGGSLAARCAEVGGRAEIEPDVGESRERAIRALLDPQSTADATREAFWELERGRDRGWASVPVLLRFACHNGADPAAVARRTRAEWALWCIAGPEGCRWLMQIGTKLDEKALAEVRRTADSLDWNGLGKALILVKSYVPELQSIGLRTIDRLIREQRVYSLRLEAYATVLRELNGIDLHDPVWSGRIMDYARRLGPMNYEATRFALGRLESPDAGERLFASVFREALLFKGELYPGPAVNLVRLAVGDDRFAAMEAIRLLQRARGEGASRALNYSLYARAQGDERAGALVRLLGKDNNLASLKVAEALARLSPNVRGSFYGVLADTTKGDVDGAEGRLSWYVVDPNPEIRRAAVKIVLLDRDAMFKPERVLAKVLGRGVVPPEGLVRELAPDRAVMSQEVLKLLIGENAAARDASLVVLKMIGVQATDVRAALQAMLRMPEEDVRFRVAELLGDEESRRLAHMPAILRDLRSDEPAVRLQAAKRGQTLAIADARITAALMKAVEDRNMPVREGIVLALERSHQSGASAMDALKQFAQPTTEPAIRAYAKAALREIEAAGAK
jgi:hypothetical protein